MSLSKKLPVRKQLRLKDYDYSSPGFYFVTIDCKFMECWFGHIHKGQMILNEFGNIALSEWIKIPSRFRNTQLNVFQIMPNHIHGIVEILSTQDSDDSDQNEMIRPRESNVWDCTRAGASPAHTRVSWNRDEESQMNEAGNPSLKSLSDIIGAYKSIVYNLCLAMHKEKYMDAVYTPIFGKIWHRSFYDRIIPDRSSFKSISRYIRNNPRKWNLQ